MSAEIKPSKSDPSSFRKPTQLTKVAHFHQLIRKSHQPMPQTWQIVVTEGFNGVAEDKISTITQSHSEDSIYKYKTSRLQKTTQMIKVVSFHQLMPQTWEIVMTEGLGPVQANVLILRKPNLPDISSRGF